MSQQSSLKEAHAAATHGNAYLRQLAVDINNVDFPALPVEDGFKLVQHLRNHIFSTAKEGKHYVVANNMTSIDESRFQDEIETLNDLLDTLDYSPDLHDWANQRRRAFVRTLEKKIPLPQLLQQWDKAQTIEDRLATLESVAHTQCATYTTDAIAFLPSAVILGTRSGALLQSYIIVDAKDLVPRLPPPIHIQEHVVRNDDFPKALKAVFHEQLHALFLQLATAAHLGMMPESHKLHDDAHLQRAKIIYSANIPSALYSSYRRQPEERLVHTQHDLFIDEFVNPPPSVGAILKRNLHNLKNQLF